MGDGAASGPTRYGTCPGLHRAGEQPEFPQRGYHPGSNPAVGIGIQQMFTNVLGANDLTATISALEQTGESQTLSAPRLTVLNNRPATISDGKVQYYYEEYTVAIHRRSNTTPPRPSSPAANRPRSPPAPS